MWCMEYSALVFEGIVAVQVALCKVFGWLAIALGSLPVWWLIGDLVTCCLVLRV